MRREGRISFVVRSAKKELYDNIHPITQLLTKHCNHKSPTNKTIGIPLDCPCKHKHCKMCDFPERSGKARRHEVKKQLRFDIRHMQYDEY